MTINQKYTHRIAEFAVKRYLQSFPVVGVTGPRQSGKSTLLKNLLPDYDYVTFDDFRNIDFFNDDPIGFMQKYSDHVIFDEVQFVPKIFNQIKLIVDNDRDNYGRFVLTGSSQFAYLQKASESLAGRIGLFQLLPYQYAELPSELTQESIYKGSYPELVNRSYKESELWYASYLDTYINKDVQALTHVGDLRDFRRLISLLAAQTSQLLDYTSYANNIGVSVPTIKRWISVLEASYIIFLLPPYFSNFGKRIIKSSKVYFYDTGLVSFLTGIRSWEHYDKGPLSGALYENYIVADILKNTQHKATLNELFFLRTSDKKEIDLIVDKKGSCDMIEIKKTATFRSAYMKTIKEFLGDNDKGYLLYNGEDFAYDPRISVINYKDYLRGVDLPLR
jgi:predicted AAA+ superfamily ATPase